MRSCSVYITSGLGYGLIITPKGSLVFWRIVDDWGINWKVDL